MNAEELIIGHFDQALSPSEQMQLESVLSNSSEARSLYERHEAIQTMMAGDVVLLGPSAALDEATLGAALGTLSQVSGGGAGAWIGSKIAAAISIVAIGGLSAALMTSSNHTSAPVPNAPTPVVRSLPNTPSPVVTVPAPEVSAPATDARQTVAQGESHKSPVKVKAAGDKAVARTKGASTSQPPLHLGGATTAVSHDPVVNPESK